MKEIKILKLDNNSEMALISWNVSSGNKVTQGQILGNVETSKVVEEVKADQEGIIFIDPKFEEEIPFNIPIAFICDSEEEFNKLKNG